MFWADAMMAIEDNKNVVIETRYMKFTNFIFKDAKPFSTWFFVVCLDTQLEDFKNPYTIR